MIRAGAATGEIHPDLFRESMELNTAPTYEQPIEGVHSLVHIKNHHHGRAFDIVGASVAIRTKFNIKRFTTWQWKLFLVALWRLYLFRRLLRNCDLNREFVDHGSGKDIRKAICHALPRQMFKQHEAVKTDVFADFMSASRPSPVELAEAHKLFVKFFKSRLDPGTICSLPKVLVDAAPADDGSIKVGAGYSTLVEEALAIINKMRADPGSLEVPASSENLDASYFYKVALNPSTCDGP